MNMKYVKEILIPESLSPYRELEYIYFSGTEYILTNDKPTNGKTYYLDYALDSIVDDKFIFATDGDIVSDETFYVGIKTSLPTQSQKKAQSKYGRTTSNLSLGNISANKFQAAIEIHNDFSARFVSYAFEGSGGGEQNYTAATFIPANMNPFAIMGWNNSGTVTNLSAGKVYRYIAGSGNVYVPVQRKSDGVCGLCNKTDYTFLPMVGTNITTAAAGTLVAENPDWATHPVIKIENSYGVTLWTPYVPPTLNYITVSGMTTTFDLNDTFVFDGTVTAHYIDTTTANVTALSTFSGYNMSQAGLQTVTVSYTEGGITETTTYSIEVQGVTPVTDITVTHSVAELATAHSWTNATFISGYAFDYDNANPEVMIYGTADGANTYYSPKYYSTSPGTLRCYGYNVDTNLGQNFMSLQIPSAKKFKKIKCTFTNGYLFVSDGNLDPYGTVRTQLTTNVELDVSSLQTSVLMIYCGANSTGLPTSSNARISSITVTYGV